VVIKYFLLGCLVLAPMIPAQAQEQLASTQVEYRDTAVTYSIEGLVESTRQSTVSAQISGRVKAVLFDVGDHVKKGQVILRIDQREADEALAGSQATVMQAQAKLKNAQMILERDKQLWAQHFISQAALDIAQADYQVALAQASMSQANAEQAGLSQGYTTVLAPYGGVVSARLVELGEMVIPGKPLMTGYDPASLRVVVNVPQQKLSEISLHPQASIEVPALNRRIKAISTVVQPVADTRTHETQVRINLSSNQSGIYPGMFVTVHFETGRQKVLTIPASAVLRRSEVVAVYVVDEKNNVHLRQVRLGELQNEGRVEVLAGLNVGERIASDPIRAGMNK
jgi:RND family efflux transporter MFP subunit